MAVAGLTASVEGVREGCRSAREKNRRGVAKRMARVEAGLAAVAATAATAAGAAAAATTAAEAAGAAAVAATAAAEADETPNKTVAKPTGTSATERHGRRSRERRR